ncbi:GNAT family N-acetyltransferase [Streptomyces sp. H39-S7]|uniref:GNAT family N-acetyltransferase n=1 Tax=Streptomyces sp. H39-S7 TaxID=3004357 RepID=UPI0022AFF764|nr:GNAT family N-acetyltransferase [Streptomyces sp. H39-S7]MCZ4120163.1 GNAT family N-acetyltransferase [Streptomyces sp. H39-S7]
MDIVIRPARADELEEAGRITAEAFIADGHTSPDGTYAPKLRDARARASAAEVLVAVDAADDTLLGCVTFAPPGSPWGDIARDGEAEFRMLGVDPAARGRGAGEALVLACVERARALGVRQLVMSTQQSMSGAHRIYERLGFRRTPERDWSPVPNVDLFTYALPL